MSEKMYFAAANSKGFIKAMTISQSVKPALYFSLHNPGFAVMLMSTAQIREAYIKIGLRFEVERTQKNPFVA